jgi:hypothetical protein
MQSGPYDSVWIRVSDPSSARVAAAIQHHSAVASEGALYVAFDEWSVHRVISEVLKSCGFKFHAHKDDSSEFVYYKWRGAGVDKVPKTATSIEGAAVRHARAFQREDLTLRGCRGDGPCFVA